MKKASENLTLYDFNKILCLKSGRRNWRQNDRYKQVLIRAMHKINIEQNDHGDCRHL
jgi:hypothetical protein